MPEEYVSICNWYRCTITDEENELIVSEIDDNPYCEEHYSEHMEENRGDEDVSDGPIHDYGYKPGTIFWSDSGEKTYQPPISKGRERLVMGMELETENKGPHNTWEMAEKLLEQVNEKDREEKIYIKSDSSLYAGMEIVSHPGTLEYYKNHFNWQASTNLARYKFEAWNTSTCGLHIHMNKKAFLDDKHLFKFLAFVYKNKKQFVEFSGRESHNYASYDIERFLNSRIDWSDYDEDERNDYDVENRKRMRGTSLGKMVKGESVNMTRGVAVNLQPEKTVELRLFKPSLKVNTVIASLELCDALFNYTELITTNEILKQNALTFISFRDYVKAKGNNYQALSERIELRCHSLRGQ